MRIYVRDDTPPSLQSERELIAEIVGQFRTSLPIELTVNPENLGYPRNLATMVENSSEEFIFLVAQDDILSPIAIETCLKALELFPQAGGVARPYYWFDSDIDKPVRRVPSLSRFNPILVSTKSSWKEIQLVLFAAGQLTGLMYRRSRLREPFSDSVFPAHVAPFAGLLRDFGVVYVPEITVAVSIRDSQTRFLNSIYQESPIYAWLSMYQSVFGPEENSSITKNGRKIHMGKNYVGLIQIRTYGRLRWFIREGVIMVKIRPINIIDPRFIVTFTLLLCLPPKISRFFTDIFKSRVMAVRFREHFLARDQPRWWNPQLGND